METIKLENFLSAYKQIEENEKRYKINFLVTSHKDYYKTTLPILLQSMIIQIPVERILLIIGGMNEERNFRYHGIEIHYVKYNCWDHSGFVYMAENWEKYRNWGNYIFNLHDTCQCGFYFNKLVYNFPSEIETYAVWNKSSSNLGLYKSTYFEKKIPQILENKKVFLQYGKRASLMLEDTLWTYPKSDRKPAYNHHSTIDEPGMGDKLIQVGGNPIGYKIPYKGTNKERRALCYRKLNLYKFKSAGVPAQGI